MRIPTTTPAMPAPRNSSRPAPRKRSGTKRAAFVFSVCSTFIFLTPPLRADLITTWPLYANYSADDVKALDFFPLSSEDGLQLPPLVNFIYLLPTGAQRGIDYLDQWTITANIEAGHIWNEHEMLQHVKQFVNDPSTQDSDKNPFTPEYDRHATGVGSILAGRDLDGQPFGVAHNTELHSGALSTQWSGEAYSGTFATTPEAVSTVYSAFFGFADVINSSWGGPDPTGTSFSALITDGLANQYPSSTFIASAGNAGPGPNTVGGPGSGYNNIAVGALENNGANLYQTVARFSGRGPQDYSDPVNGTILGVRAEVDIVAPGTHLTTAHYGGQTGGNHPELPKNIINGGPNAYMANMKGTSFAAPLVSGTAALIIHTAKSTLALANNPHARDARVIKSVLLNSADKIPGWNNGQLPHPNKNGGVITQQALDWTSGTGALNAGRALDHYLAAATRDVSGLSGGTVKKTGWDYGRVEIEKSNIYRINEILTADSLFGTTLSWFRERSFTPETLTSQESGHSDLDLIVRDTITNKVIAESISTYNVVEHLYFTLPATSLYQIEVNYSGNLFGSMKKEEYGLAWFAIPPTETRCRNVTGAAKPIKTAEPHPVVCLAGAHPPLRVGSALPRGGWLVAK